MADVVESAEALEFDRHHFVSFTGGEPLLQPQALLALTRHLRGRGPRMHLETHGLLADALAEVIDEIDVVSMDWKLVSDVRRASDPARGSVAEFHREHEAFLRVARGAAEVSVKVVVTCATADAEIDEMTRCIGRVADDVPVIVQPVTPVGGVREAPGPERLLALAARIQQSLPDTRLIPQTHRSYGAL